VFAEVARVLAPTGRWVILDMVEHDREEYRDTMGHQHLGFSASAIHELAAGAGLVVRSLRVLPPDPAAHGPALCVAVLGAGGWRGGA
jgi:ArsR family transcriptional regulator